MTLVRWGAEASGGHEVWGWSAVLHLLLGQGGGWQKFVAVEPTSIPAGLRDSTQSLVLCTPGSLSPLDKKAAKDV